LKSIKKKNILTILVRQNLKKEKKRFLGNHVYHKLLIFFDVARNFNDTLRADQSEMTRADKRTSPRDQYVIKVYKHI
jgi:hypothetical protein